MTKEVKHSKFILVRNMNYYYTLYRTLEDYYLKSINDEIKLSSVEQYFSNDGYRKDDNNRIIYVINGTDEKDRKCIYHISIEKGSENKYRAFISDYDSKYKPIRTKNVNYKRLAIIGSCFILAAGTLVTIKSAKKALKEDQEAWLNSNSAPDYAYDNPSLNPELDNYYEEIRQIQRKESLEEQYEILLGRALSGDTEALEILRGHAFSGDKIAVEKLVNYLDITSQNEETKIR